MGEKANPPVRKRSAQRAEAAGTNEPLAAGNKVASRARRVSRTKAKRSKEPKERHVFVESVPPDMVAEVFEVAGADDDVIVSSMPAPPPHAHAARPLSIPPAPHPPRPTQPPPAPHRQRPTQPPPAPHRQHPTQPPPADAGALELLPDDLEVLEPSNSNPEIGVALLTPLPTGAGASRNRSRPVYRVWLAVGALALVSGIVLGVRLRTADHAPATVREDARSHPTPRETTLGPTEELKAEPATSVASSASAATTSDSATAPPALPLTSEPASETASASATTSEDHPKIPPVGASSTPVGAQRLQESGRAPEGTPFDTQAASAALSTAFQRATVCRGPSDPSGTVTALLTFAPSGRVTTATVSGTFAGTPIGGCIASALRSARVPPFAGEHVTVKRTVELR
jgi:hypothetical protein